MDAPHAPQSFRGLLLRHRGRSGLIQRDLAARAGVSRGAVQDWEAGLNYPTVERLQALIQVLLESGGLTLGREAVEARELWAAAERESPRMHTPFDDQWFEGLLAAHLSPTSRPASDTLHEVPAAAPGNGAVEPTFRFAPRGARAQDWGEAPDTVGFVGRADELALLRRWVLQERCRLVALLGMGGIGKTSLTGKLAQDVALSFERVYWRSLRDAPPVSEWLAGAIGFLSDQQLVPPAAESERLAALLRLLRERRCLLVLDNSETLFEPGHREGRYRAGMQGYGRLLQAVGQASHQSCLILTSREAPPELAVLSGAVRTLDLSGLGSDEAQVLLAAKQLDGTSQQWGELNARYGGNGLALKVVGETIRELFGGEIGTFLEAGSGDSVFGGIRRLLSEQVERSSAVEQKVLRLLAVEREPVSLGQIMGDLGPSVGRGVVLEAVEALRRRSLMERAETPGAAAFTLQSVVMEYVIDHLIEDVADEIARGQPALLVELPLIKAQAKDYVRQTQERLIGAPMLQRLNAQYGEAGTQQRLLTFLSGWRGRPAALQGYGPGNVVNLLRLLRGGLRALDLSHLAIRQAYLAEADAQDTSLVGTQLAETVLAEAFSAPPCVALSGDGVYLAAGTFMGEVYLWRVYDRALLASLRGHAGMTLSVALSEHGERLASSSDDGMVKLWNARNGELVATFNGHQGGATAVALCGNGRLVASGDAAGTIRVWSADDGQLVSSVAGPGEAIWGIAFDSAGTRLAAASGSKVQVWEPESGRLVATLEGHHGGNFSAALSADGTIVASGSFDGNVRVWQVGTGQLIATLLGHTSGAWSIGLSGSGDRVVSGCFDGAVRAWDVLEGRLTVTMTGHTGAVPGVAISRDGSLCASASYDGTVRLWQADGKLLDEFRGYTTAIRAIAMSASGQLCASASFDRTVRLWDVNQHRLVTTFVGHTGAVWAVAMSRDGQLVASGGDDGAVRVWQANQDQPIGVLQGHSGAIFSVAIGEDKRNIVSGSLDGTARLWTSETGNAVAVLDAQTGPVWAVAISRDSRLLASGGVAGVITLWDVPTQSARRVLRGHASGTWGLALSTDGRLLASASFDATARLWDTRSGDCMGVLEGHTGGVWSTALSDDGQLIATAGFDGVVRLWDMHTLQELDSLRSHTGGIWSIAFDEHAQVLASAGVDGAIVIWDLEHAAILHRLKRDRIYERLDITSLTGVTDAQRGALLRLGAVERETEAATIVNSAQVSAHESRR
jgi:WD40 repeat protein/transcriptional regulator with XRE-family HTH domain